MGTGSIQAAFRRQLQTQLQNVRAAITLAKCCCDGGEEILCRTLSRARAITSSRGMLLRRIPHDVSRQRRAQAQTKVQLESGFLS